MAAHPAVVMEAQFQLWRDYMGLWETHRAPHAGRRSRAGGRAGRRRQALQGQGLAGKPDLRLHQAELSADRELDAGHGRQGRTASRRRRRRSASTSTPSSSPTRSRRPISCSPIPKCCARRCSRNGENLVKGLEQSAGRYRARRGPAFHPPVGRRVQDRREHRHRAGQGRVPQRADRAAAVSIRRPRRSTRGRC